MPGVKRYLWVVSWVALSFALIVTTSIALRTRVSGRSFDTRFLAVTSTRPFERLIPLADRDFFAQLPEVASFTFAAAQHAGEEGRTFEVIAASQESLGVVDDAGHLQTRSLGPGWIVLDAPAVRAWRADPDALLVAHSLAKTYGWKIGDTITFPLYGCGGSLSGVVRGFATGNVGRRVLAHYENLDRRLAGCPTHDQVTLFELEVNATQQRALADRIDAHFEHDPHPTVSSPMPQFYRTFFVPKGASIALSVTVLFIGIVVALLVLTVTLFGKAFSPRLVLAGHALAVLTSLVGFACYRIDGFALSKKWGLENVNLSPEALATTLVTATVLLALLWIWSRHSSIAAWRVSSVPFVLIVGLLSAAPIAAYFGIEDGVAVRARDVDADDDRRPIMVSLDEEVAGARKARAELLARPGDCVTMRFTLDGFFARGPSNARVLTSLEGRTPLEARCGKAEPPITIERGRMVSLDGKTESPTGMPPLPVTPLAKESSLLRSGYFMDLDELLEKLEPEETGVLLVLGPSAGGQLNEEPSRGDFERSTLSTDFDRLLGLGIWLAVAPLGAAAVAKLGGRGRARVEGLALAAGLAIGAVGPSLFRAHATREAFGFGMRVPVTFGVHTGLAVASLAACLITTWILRRRARE